jgi:GTP diphosphokinase / guanosine-3',5'-bis(diphosphate) 3'-diphosphatase
MSSDPQDEPVKKSSLNQIDLSNLPLTGMSDPVPVSLAASITHDKAYYDSQFAGVLQEVGAYTRQIDMTILKEAFEYSFARHHDQFRKSGLPYFDHLIEVVKILAQQQMDIQTLAAAFLHDVIEDTGTTYEQVRHKFGTEIADLVDGVTKIGGFHFNSVEITQAENYRKMLLSLIKDIRVIIIKLSDRLHNMRTIDSLPKKKQERIAIETRDVYAPLAHRFGMARIRWELEDLVLKTLDIDTYNEISRLVSENRLGREGYIETVAKPIRMKLSEFNVQSQITGRPKHFFSIYNKMKKRGKPFHEIYDLLAIRIIVEQKEDCYNALGIVHSTYKPVNERFKDYIAVPKINGYQSIHTTVIGPDGKMVEIQIRSKEMHQIAEEGIAAHWLYKENRLEMDQFDKQISWIRQLIDRQTEPGDFVEDLKIDLFRDEVFVFTPKGDLLQLPAGSTPIDLAFAVHSEVGTHCIGAKVNGRVVTLHSELMSGDQVEILTSGQQTPSIHWLEIVKTSKARNYIKRYFRNTELEQSIALGKDLLIQELKHQGIRKSLAELHEELIGLSEELKYDNLDMMFSAVGRGIHSVQGLVQKIANKMEPDKKDQSRSFFRRLIQRSPQESEGIMVNGMDNMMIHFAGCCNPIPGDTIIGYVTRGKGINVHRSDCLNIIEAAKKEPDRAVQVSWSVDDTKTFLVQIKVIGSDRKNFLSDVTQKIATTDTNIASADMKTTGNENSIDFIIQVRNNKHLMMILDRIRKVPGVIHAKRVDVLSIGKSQSRD